MKSFAALSSVEQVTYRVCVVNAIKMQTTITVALFLAICAAIMKSSDAIPAMSMDQLQEAGIMLRKSCTHKTGVDKELLRKMDNSEIVDDHTLKCYMNCVHKTMMMMKKGKYSPDKAIAQMRKVLPQDMKQIIVDVIEACRQAGADKADTCEASYEHVKCCFDHGREYFFFP